MNFWLFLRPLRVLWFYFLFFKTIASGIYHLHLIVVLQPEVRDQFLAAQMPECILEFHQLNEQVVFGIEPGGAHRRFEVKREPFLYSAHSHAL